MTETVPVPVADLEALRERYGNGVGLLAGDKQAIEAVLAHLPEPDPIEPDIVDRLRSLGLMDDACDGCVPEECGDKMVATITNDAADEIEALRSILRALNVKATSLDMGGRHHYSGRGYLTPSAQQSLARAFAAGRHDYRRARGVIDLAGEPSEQAIRRQRDGADQ